MIDEAKSRSTSKLRPDTIYKTNFNSADYTFIIDAKMYHYGYYSTNDDQGIKKINKLPQSDSLQKQITYGDFVKHNLE